MLWFKSQYVRFLEEERSRLLAENVALRKYQTQLVERMFSRNFDEPTVRLNTPPTAKGIERFLEETDIFADIQEPKQDPEMVDNRKEAYDAY